MVPRHRGKILAALDLYRRHESAVRSRLLELNLNWDASRRGKSNWANIIAALETAPWDSAIRQAEIPDSWQWGNPLYEPVLTSMEALIAANIQRSGDKAAANRFKRIPRPGDPAEQKLATAVTTIDELNALFDN